MKDYGTIIPGLTIDGALAEYPVVNEREVRGAAGIMFLIGSITFFFALFTKDLSVAAVVVPLFWLDFFLKTVFQPYFSPFANIAMLFVFNQQLEYVGAIQKRFAWGIGLCLATLVLIVLFVFGVRGPIPFILCAICLFFMWLEASFGICVGCKIYLGLLNKGMLKEPKVRPACPGGVCSINKGK